MTTLQETPRLWAEIEEYKRLKAELEIKLELLQEVSISLHDPLLSPKEQMQLQSIRNQTISYIEALRQRLKGLRDKILKDADENGIEEKAILDILGTISSESSVPEIMKTETKEEIKFSKSSRVALSPLTQSPFDELGGIYEFLEFLGEGGFARVFKAKRKKDGKVIAVKIPKTLDPATGRAFVREISNWLHLKHPNIVELYDVNVIPIPYLEMEYCESSLEKLPKPMEIKKAALLIFNIAEGLKYAHSKGVIHRDLKPSNILLKQGVPKISDWGLSKIVTESHSTTITSFTPFYASPEQIDRNFGHTDERTDIWQLGVIFYELITGRLPFEGDNMVEVLFNIIRRNPVPPTHFSPDAKKIEPIILRMIAKRKEDRYQLVEELQRDLAKILNITYMESLKESRTLGDNKMVIYYLTELLLVNLKVNNIVDAYKYASDLLLYARGDLKTELEELLSQLKHRLEEGLDIPQELIKKAEIITYKMKTKK